MQRGVIILCGGQSTRMGHDKASLPFGTETMLERVTRIVGEVVARENVVVVPAPQQQLGPLPQVIVACDAVAHRGPLAGLATGLRALRGERPNIDAIFTTGCDFPLLVPAFIGRMFTLLQNFDAAVPFDRSRRYPLAAVYHPRVLPVIDQMLAAETFKAQDLFNKINTRDVLLDDLRIADPNLHSLRNVNTQAEYADTLAIAGLATRGDFQRPDRYLK